MERWGCRYLCLFIEADSFELRRLSIKSVYPFQRIEKDFGDERLNRMYEIGRHTLELCAHEHYEDYLWREQALYGMDSRHQILFGYGAFEEYEYPRENLRLMARSIQDDEFIELCAPSRISFNIPSFGAYWILAVCENAERDFDEAFVNEMIPYCERMLLQFERRTTEIGLRLFSEPQYWNFHDWSVEPDRGTIEQASSFSAYSKRLLEVLGNYYDPEKADMNGGKIFMRSISF